MSDMVLPTDSDARKGTPMARGLLDYFPGALAEVSRLSLAATQKHNPGGEMRWARDKSTDHADTIIRHLTDRGTIDPEDGIRHSVKVAWRALALLQEELEADGATPGRASHFPEPEPEPEPEPASPWAFDLEEWQRAIAETMAELIEPEPEREACACQPFQCVSRCPVGDPGYYEAEKPEPEPVGVGYPEFFETIEECKARLARERYAPVVKLYVDGVELGTWDAPSEHEAAQATDPRPYARTEAGTADKFAAEVHGHIARSAPIRNPTPIPHDRIGTCEGVIGGWHE